MSAVSDDKFQGSGGENRNRINEENDGTTVGSTEKKEEEG